MSTPSAIKQKLNVHSLSKAINQFDIESITKHPAELLNTQSFVQCEYDKCVCTYGLSIQLMHLLFDFNTHDIHHTYNKYHLIEQLFEKKWLLESLITDEHLIHIVNANMDADSYYQLIRIVLKYIPKIRWIKVKSNQLEPLLHVLISGSIHQETKCEYIKMFIEVGCDPTAIDPIYGTSLLDKSIMDANLETCEFLMKNYKLKISPCILFDLLSTYRYCKDIIKIQNIAKIVSLIVSYYSHYIKYDIPKKMQGYNYPVAHQSGITIYDYIIKYQWTELLMDVPLPIEYAPNANIEEKYPTLTCSKPNVDLFKFKKIYNLAHRYRFCKDEKTICEIANIILRKIKHITPTNKISFIRYNDLFGFIDLIENQIIFNH